MKISAFNQLEENGSHCLSGQFSVLFAVFNRMYPKDAFWGDHHWQSQVVIHCWAHQGKELEQLSPPAPLGGWQGLPAKNHCQVLYFTLNFFFFLNI